MRRALAGTLTVAVLLLLAFASRTQRPATAQTGGVECAVPETPIVMDPPDGYVAVVTCNPDGTLTYTEEPEDEVSEPDIPADQIEVTEIALPDAPEPSVDLATYPLVGSWVVTSTDPHDSEFPALVTFHADGTVIATDSARVTWHGEWRVSADGTADFLYQSLGADGTVENGVQYLALGIEVSADGNTWDTGDVTGAQGKRIRIEDAGHQVDSTTIQATVEARRTAEAAQGTVLPGPGEPTPES
jgi:hypothetical protein